MFPWIPISAWLNLHSSACSHERAHLDICVCVCELCVFGCEFCVCVYCMCVFGCELCVGVWVVCVMCMWVCWGGMEVFGGLFLNSSGSSQPSALFMISTCCQGVGCSPTYPKAPAFLPRVKCCQLQLSCYHVTHAVINLHLMAVIRRHFRCSVTDNTYRWQNVTVRRVRQQTMTAQTHIT